MPIPSATADAAGGLMTVGQLARRTGLSHKSIRDLEGRGLIYSAGRSESNYRLFDETALWCVRVVGALRSLGLTLAEIEQLDASYREDPVRSLGPQLARLLDRSEQRIRAHIREHEQTLKRIDAARQQNLADAADIDTATVDSRAATRRVPAACSCAGRQAEHRRVGV
ncbi:MAG: MerR family transcriptional regulator [Solirubrobacteraceae bacterium]